MDLLQIVETEVRISQFTWLKQAGMGIENGPRCRRAVDMSSLTKSIIRFTDIRKCQIKVHLIGVPYRSGNNESGLFVYDIYLTGKIKINTRRKSNEIGLHRGHVLWISLFISAHGRNVLCTHEQGLHRLLVWFNLHEHSNGNIIILMKFSSLAAHEVVFPCNQ